MSDDLSVYPLSVSEWDDSLSQVVADMNGNPLNVHKLMANHPELLCSRWRFGCTQR